VGTIDNTEWNKAEKLEYRGSSRCKYRSDYSKRQKGDGGTPRYPTITANTSGAKPVKIDPGGRVDVAPGVVVTIVE
jgi:hypothetical protein